MKLRTRIAPIAMTAALSLGLAACGGDDPEPTTTEEMTEDDMDDMTEGDMTEDDMDDMTEGDDMTESDDMTEEEG